VSDQLARTSARRDGGIDLSLISVAYRSGAYIAGSLRSVLGPAAAAGLSVEVIVVDNDSPDAEAEAVLAVAPDALIIRNRRNLGFARANNQAFEVANGRYWLLLNPDATLMPGSLAELVRHMESHPLAGAVAPSIRRPGVATGAESAGMLPGLRSAIGHFLFVNRLLSGDAGGPYRGFQLRGLRGGDPIRIEWASAAALLTRPAAIRAVGGFDSSIFMYGEDVDLGRRLRSAGWEVWLVPAAGAAHSISAAAGGVQTRWIDSLHRDYAQRAGRVRLATFDSVIATGLALRAIAASFGPDPDQVRRLAHGSRRAIRLAGSALVTRTARKDRTG
jgi:N-acetylglucosaminyl-diphospho-decaprenol L-rhamnosyltransferase